MGTNYYQVLGVRNGANPAEIDLAYKALSQVPDLDVEAQLEISVAYQTLMHPSRRAEFDKSLVQPEAKSSAQEPALVQEQVLKMIADYRRVNIIPVHIHTQNTTVAEARPHNKALTGFAIFYMLGFAAISILSLVALVI